MHCGRKFENNYDYDIMFCMIPETKTSSLFYMEEFVEFFLNELVSTARFLVHEKN